MAEKHTVRDGIIAGTIAALLGSLLLDPVRAFVVAAWHLITRVPGTIWHGLTASVPVPVWVLLLVAGAIAVVTRWLASSVEVVATLDPEPAPAPVALEPAVSPELTNLEDKIIRIMAQEDGSPLRISELATKTGATLLRVEQAVEGLEDRHHLVHRHRTLMDGTFYGLTKRGRDLVIARGDA